MAGVRKYRVTLSEEERANLEPLVYGDSSKERKRRAQILLMADGNAPGGRTFTDADIAVATGAHVNTVEKVRKRCVLEGVERALERQEQKNRKPRIIDGDAEAHLIAMSCGEPPEGRKNWTLRLLADRLVELKIVEEVSTETVRKNLKKKTSNHGK